MQHPAALARSMILTMEAARFQANHHHRPYIQGGFRLGGESTEGPIRPTEGSSKAMYQVYKAFVRSPLGNSTPVGARTWRSRVLETGLELYLQGNCNLTKAT